MDCSPTRLLTAMNLFMPLVYQQVHVVRCSRGDDLDLTLPIVEASLPPSISLFPPLSTGTQSSTPSWQRDSFLQHWNRLFGHMSTQSLYSTNLPRHHNWNSASAAHMIWGSIWGSWIQHINLMWGNLKGKEIQTYMCVCVCVCVCINDLFCYIAETKTTL